jgi:hypothetical protein
VVTDPSTEYIHRLLALSLGDPNGTVLVEFLSSLSRHGKRGRRTADLLGPSSWPRESQQMDGVDGEMHQHGAMQSPGQIIGEAIADTGDRGQNDIDDAAAEMRQTEQNSGAADAERSRATANVNLCS